MSIPKEDGFDFDKPSWYMRFADWLNNVVRELKKVFTRAKEDW